MTQSRQRKAASLAKAGAAIAMVCLAPSTAAADNFTPPTPSAFSEFTLKLEPGLAIPLAAPQSKTFDLGGAQTMKALWNLNPFVDIGPSVSFVALPNENSDLASGMAWTYGLGLRVKRPHDTPNDDPYFSASPWVDTDVLYVRTGSLHRAGVSAGTGLAFPIGASRVFWLGPFVRYTHIFQNRARSGYDNHDAKLLIVGLSLEGGSGLPARAPDPAACEPKRCPSDAMDCTDTDGDGLPDKIDRCPHAVGPVDNWGCAVYKRLVVKPDKLELKERIYFAWNQAVLQDISFPLLDEVVQALTDNKNFRVQVEGHTSSEGGDDHNQTLSEKRAQAVLDYLVFHGIARNRLDSKGFSSSDPADTNTTIEGRENNRRVEFVVQFNILTDGSK